MLKNVKDHIKGIGCVIIVWVVLSILYLVLNQFQ